MDTFNAAKTSSPRTYITCINQHSFCTACTEKLVECPTCSAPFSGVLSNVIASVSTDIDSLSLVNAKDFVPPYIGSVKINETYCVCGLHLCVLCYERRRRRDMRDHLETEHPERLYEDELSITGSTIIADFVYRGQVYALAFGELFGVYRIYRDDTMHFIVQYVGAPENASKYAYDVEIFLEEGPGKKFTASGICATDVVPDDIIDGGFCVSIPFEQFKLFANGAGAVSWKIDLRLNDKDV